MQEDNDNDDDEEEESIDSVSVVSEDLVGEVRETKKYDVPEDI